MTRTVHIVAGGSSLRDFDWTSLRDKPVIAINNAAFRLPFARHVYFADRDWFECWRKDLMRHDGMIHQGVSDEHQWVGHTWVQRWDFASQFSLSPRTLIGGCSGNAAINLAAQLGYDELHLLGYDFDTSGNFHNENLHDNHRPDVWRRAFDAMLPALERRQVQIVSGAPRG